MCVCTRGESTGGGTVWGGGGGHLVLQVEDLLITLTPIWIYERLLGMRTVFKGVRRVCMPARLHHACSAY